MSATINVIGSSSAGNAYMLKCGNDSLLIEAGVAWSKLRQYILAECGNLRGCLISHEHKDHSQSAANIAYYRIPIYASAGTLIAINDELVTSQAVAVNSSHIYRIGSFKVMPFKTQHDAAEPMGFMIHHEECGVVVFATDTYYVKPKFRGVRTWLLECNYCDTIASKNLNKGQINSKQYERLKASHMELEQTVATLRANDLSNTERVILIHLSDRNSDEERMIRAVKKATALPCITAAAQGPQLIKI